MGAKRFLSDGSLDQIECEWHKRNFKYLELFGLTELRHVDIFNNRDILESAESLRPHPLEELLWQIVYKTALKEHRLLPHVSLLQL